MTPTAYLRELAQAITRQEDLTDAEASQVLYELALRIYALLLATLPPTSFERQLRWPTIRRQLLPLLLEANARLATLLTTRLEATEPLVLRTNERYFNLPADSLPPRPTPELLSTTSVVGTSLEALFTAPPTTGLSPFVLQLLRLLERSIFAAVFRDAPTPDVAASLLTPQIRAGITTLVPLRGTVANAWRERFRSIVAASLWSLVTPAQLRTAEAAPPEAQPTQWRWNAILDPRTCPICRPLHNTVAPAPSAFPRGAPPLHPLCRCAVIPLRGITSSQAV